MLSGGRGLARNPFHFTEGFGNPVGERETAERALVRAGQGEPEWAVGGSYQVVRIIRFATELWDKDCFRRDLAQGFEAVQKRLAGEAMAKYLLTTGGGYFFVPPPGDAWLDAVAPA
ncbi:Dyp-type peroxidase [Streptomyces sp. GMY02]|uniref:Dyp-type peroxidase domain-containing protein n=1 Tax=Streptomyces sp. GMY02 TaxID=1333528 RepID=UPI001C2BD591|nr:Dyp-type peroxidase domain-containing protein [Streptomyces sp. GMY02]QXE34107.1 Dyp-type peroxidase [Streptomyces sp. GMY02]